MMSATKGGGEPISKVNHGVRKVYHGVRKVYHGVRKVYHGVKKVRGGLVSPCPVWSGLD